jgi:hypothetical protein
LADFFIGFFPRAFSRVATISDKVTTCFLQDLESHKYDRDFPDKGSIKNPVNNIINKSIISGCISIAVKGISFF